MKIRNKVMVTLGMAAVGAVSSQAQITLESGSFAPLTTFGNNGWLAPNGTDGSTFSYLDSTSSNERGLAYGDGDLFLVNHTGSIDVLNPSTGAFDYTLSTTGMSGGTYLVDMIAVGGDGTVYVGNLTTTATSPFKVYAYSSSAVTSGSTAPTVFYSGNPIGGATRLGDSMAAIGSGTGTQLAVGFGNAGTSDNGYEIITSSGATAVTFATTPPAAGDFRLGITFTDPSHVICTQGTTIRYSGFSGTSGTLISSYTPASTAERPLAYTTIDGQSIMAAISTGDNHLSLYDMTVPGSPVLLGQANATTGTLASNANGTGDVSFGTAVTNLDGSVTDTVYAMSTNDGIEAYTFTLAPVPEPSTVALGSLGAGAFYFWRRRSGKAL